MRALKIFRILFTDSIATYSNNNFHNNALALWKECRMREKCDFTLWINWIQHFSNLIFSVFSCFSLVFLTELLMLSISPLELCKKDLLFLISWGGMRVFAFITHGSIYCSASWCWEVDFSKDLAFSQMCLEWTLLHISMGERMIHDTTLVFPPVFFWFYYSHLKVAQIIWKSTKNWLRLIV